MIVVNNYYQYGKKKILITIRIRIFIDWFVTCTFYNIKKNETCTKRGSDTY